MISDLGKVAPKIAEKRKIFWGDTLKGKFWKLDKDVESGAMTKEAAVKAAAAELKIENPWEDDYKELERSIR